MLYLEDYLEMIEHLPQELRDRFTEMREMDLQVQNAMDSIDGRVKQFFLAAKKMKQPERDAEYQKIDQDYYKALEDADEKIHIANQIYELLERYIRKLDQELQKFKMELEADNAGITQILEQRSYELDKPPSVSTSLPLNSIKTEKRKHAQMNNSLPYNPLDKLPSADKLIPPSANDIMRDTLPVNRASMTGHSPSSSSTSSSCSMNSLPERSNVLTQSKGHPFGGGNALAAAASQAIAATQQSLKRSSNQSQSSIVQQGRRTASLKASYEAINVGFPNLGKEFTFTSRDLSSLQAATVNTSQVNSSVATTSSSSSENKVKTKKASRTNVLVQQQQPPEPPPIFDDSEDSSAVDESGLPVDWSCDPNEPRYCICNQVSYGDMVACDNADCPFEWFHYQCVGITQPPKGKWFCPQCTISMKRRRKEK